MNVAERGPAKTPAPVRAALWINLLLLPVALIAPRTVSDGGFDAAATAALLFVVPMILMLVIGVAAAIHAVLAARRQDLRPSPSAFLPLAVFLAGIAVTMILVYGEYI